MVETGFNCILLNCGKLGETAGHRVKPCRFSFEISAVFVSKNQLFKKNSKKQKVFGLNKIF